MSGNFLGKKAQIGETLTWVVATVIIFVVLFFSIYSASALAKNVKILDLRENSNNQYGKTLFALLSSENNGGKIFDKLAEKNNQQELNKIQNVLKRVYPDENLKVEVYDYNPWKLGIFDSKILQRIKLNKESSLFLSDEGVF